MSLRDEATEQLVDQDLRVQEPHQQGEDMMKQADAGLNEIAVDDAHLSKYVTLNSLSHGQTAEHVHSTTPETTEQAQELEHLEVDDQRSSEYHFQQGQYPKSLHQETAVEQSVPAIEKEEPQQAEASATVSEAAFEPAAKQIEILPLLDITGELRFVKERQTFLAKEGRPHGDIEWAALHEVKRNSGGPLWMWIKKKAGVPRYAIF